MSIGERILELRRELDLSAAALAEKADITQAMVTRYEKGGVTPTYKVLKKLAKAFGMSVESLTNGGKAPVKQFQLAKEFEDKLIAAKTLRTEDAMTAIGKVIDCFVELEGMKSTLNGLVKNQPKKHN